MEAKQHQAVRAPCSSCGGGEKSHDVVYAHDVGWDNDEGGEGATSYQICKCRGCGDVRFRTDTWSTLDISPFSNEPESTVRVYPEVSTTHSRAAVDADAFPDRIAAVYTETLKAFNAGCHILAGGGLRAIVEAVCIENSVAGKTLVAKIDAMATMGLLAKAQAELLHEERYIGNSALHEIEPPSKRDIQDGLDIVEGLLNTIYVLPTRAQRLKARREKKKAKFGAGPAGGGTAP